MYSRRFQKATHIRKFTITSHRSIRLGGARRAGQPRDPLGALPRSGTASSVPGMAFALEAAILEESGWNEK
jgi:hypothetical protein